VSKLQIAFESKAKTDPPSPFDERRAMARQVEKAQHKHFKEVRNAAAGREMWF
jgi:hypothetical protein